MAVSPERVRVLREGRYRGGPVVYWMSRDQRAEDNWALLFAQEMASRSGAPLAVVFCLVPAFLGATAREYGFMLKGLMELEGELDRRGLPLFLLSGDPSRAIPGFLEEHSAGALVTDFSPLRIGRDWRGGVAERIDLPFYEVDAHNIVPCWIASGRQEWAAYTFRPKVYRQLSRFLEPFPPLRSHSTPWRDRGENDWEAAGASDAADSSAVAPGARAAARRLRYFIDERLSLYEAERNNPLVDGQSGLSPFLHFGQISAQRVAMEVLDSGRMAEAFIEELVVRRELSDNFCLYSNRYDGFQGFPAWARETLDAHRQDLREYVYEIDDLEGARTHDPLWNAAQMEMVIRGRMNGYLRMYWAKKILEWTESPEEALRIAIHLNDRYELDGRDPNGYTGIAWCIGGVHDRAWRERPIFGKIRYMSYAGARRRFDVQAYIDRVQALSSGRHQQG
ncbi:MAG: deoxyribodipyrimidine photo-lyase [Methanothrix sp.]|nr:deoxyribodipyrimidine photo-lyase [Methanothrix sp.]